jgi:hypothetical protein
MALANTYFNTGTYTGNGGYQRLGIPTKRAAYNLQASRSLRFRSSASAYLTRTPNSGTNRTTWTWSCWIKLGSLSVNSRIFDAFLGGSEESGVVYNKSANEFRFEYYDGSSYTTQCITSASFQDPALWYNLVVSIDTTQATASNRVKIYVNGLLQALSTATYPSQNAQFAQNSTNAHYISRLAKSAANYVDGYLSEVNFIDGQALTPTSFGEYNSDNIWVPKTFSGTYGNNGFYLPFSDNSALTTSSNAGLGKDFSTNSNYWTTNNISITSGSTYDSMIDTPTDAASATQPVGNYAVMNPKDLTNGSTTSTATFSNANLAVTSAGSNQAALATFPVSSGKWYWECSFSGTMTGGVCGIAKSNTARNNYLGYDANSWSILLGYSCAKLTNNSGSGFGTSYIGTSAASGDIIGCALDMDNGQVWWRCSSVSSNAWGGAAGGDPVAGTGAAFTGLTGNIFPAVDGDARGTMTVNFGQRPFSYTPPTGYSALCTANIIAPADASKWFNGVAPDLVWIKDRTSAYGHALVDSVRGFELTLKSNATDAEVSIPDVSDVNKFGMTVIGDTNYRVNKSTDKYVYWAWQAGGPNTSTNTSGSLTSTVSVNTTAGFSVVTYTGTGANATVGHGLGVAPSMIIGKCRSVAGGAWIVGHSGLTSPAWNNLMILNTTAAINGAGNVVWNNTAPTSTVFSLGTDTNINTNGATNVAYCFAPIAGYSAFGSYTGNGSTDGPFVYCGFRPRWVMVKNATTGGAGYDWFVWDSSRNTYNVTTLDLNPNSTNAENTNSGDGLDMLSNGFKIRVSTAATNTSGNTFIYAAFAETPFNYSRAR